MAKSPSAEVAELDALAQVSPKFREEAASKAAQAATSPEREIRAAACRALGATADPNLALGNLKKLAKDPDVGVRHEAAAVLAGCPWKGKLDLLAGLMEDEDLGVAAVAADGLSHAGDRRAAPVLHELLSHRRLRFAALEGLLAIEDPQLMDELAPDLFRRIFISPFERALAAVALAPKREDTRRYLLERMEKKKAEERPFILIHLPRLGEEGLVVLRAIAQDEGDYLRESAVLALLRCGESWWPAAQAAVIQNADEDPHVSAEVLLGLLEIDSEHARLFAAPHREREGELGDAARRVLLSAALRQEFATELHRP